ncbi:MAG: hypothetical protein IJW79_05330 [Clostridia bacterium]|nr:hypothetical protein [Clostridia bacterium]
MSDNLQTGTILSIDPKKHRIRIHKSTLHALGDPRHIQLLVSTNRRIVAVKCVDKVTSGDQSHKVNAEMLGPDNSCEIYSGSFIKELCSVVGGLEENGTYRLLGTILTSEKMAVFAMDTIAKVES